jgi:hypothetical protein
MPTTLKHYQLREEYHTLFKNLAEGEPLSQGDAFRKSGGRKSYASEEDAHRDLKAIKALLSAGFVDEIDTGLTYLEK